MPLILITGAAGFIGQELTAALLADDPSTELIITDTTIPPIPTGHAERVKSLKADLTDPSSHAALLPPGLSAAYLLHGIMSSGAEANLELGLRVNIDSHRLLLDALRASHPGLVVVFPSSIAAYGPVPTGTLVSETTQTAPQSSYGTQKATIELLLTDYTRRGLLDGRIVRLPTVVVRPGAPTAAASSFASGIVREPLRGVEAVLPVRRDLRMWVCSPAVVVANLVRAARVPAQSLGASRTVNLPGQTVAVQELLDALEAVGGREARARVVERRDPTIETIVESWPMDFDTTRAEGLGFLPDVSLAENVRLFKEGLQSEGGA